MTRADLSMFLEGIDLKAGKFRPPFSAGIRMKERESEGQKRRATDGHRGAFAPGSRPASRPL